MKEYEEVRGVIVGGNWVSWALFYDGRCQCGNVQRATDEATAQQDATALMQRLVTEHSGAPCYLYGDASKWEVRVYH